MSRLYKVVHFDGDGGITGDYLKSVDEVAYLDDGGIERWLQEHGDPMTEYLLVKGSFYTVTVKHVAVKYTVEVERKPA